MKKALCCLLWPALAHATCDPEHLRWQRQRAVTADFAFELLLAQDDVDRDAVSAIRVLARRTGAVLQEIHDVGGMPTSGPADEKLRVVDVNLDGRPDLVIQTSDGGAGPNYQMNFYLFDELRGAFELNAALSELVQPSIDPRGFITSEYRASCCEHGGSTYAFRGGKLLEVKQWGEAMTSDGRWIESWTRTLVNGRWLTRSRRVRARGH